MQSALGCWVLAKTTTSLSRTESEQSKLFILYEKLSRETLPKTGYFLFPVHDFCLSIYIKAEIVFLCTIYTICMSLKDVRFHRKKSWGFFFFLNTTIPNHGVRKEKIFHGNLVRGCSHNILWMNPNLSSSVTHVNYWPIFPDEKYDTMKLQWVVEEITVIPETK